MRPFPFVKGLKASWTFEPGLISHPSLSNWLIEICTAVKIVVVRVIVSFSIKRKETQIKSYPETN